MTKKIQRTDTERLDFLQQLTEKGSYTGTVLLRNSTTGRGWRLHETSWPGAVTDVRQAIDNYIDGKEGQETSMEELAEKLADGQFRYGDGDE